MDDVTEEIRQGYCRAIDQSRMVTCEYTRKDDKWVLEHTDCNYGACVHSRTCRIMEEAEHE